MCAAVRRLCRWIRFDRWARQRALHAAQQLPPTLALRLSSLVCTYRRYTPRAYFLYARDTLSGFQNLTKNFRCAIDSRVCASATLASSARMARSNSSSIYAPRRTTPSIKAAFLHHSSASTWVLPATSLRTTVGMAHSCKVRTLLGESSLLKRARTQRESTSKQR